MPRKNFGELCINCGKTHTTHPTGLCSRCRKLRGVKPCIVCGLRKTSAPDGLCSVCRTRVARKKKSGISLEQAIENTEQLLAILKNREKGMSYSTIAEVLGIPRSTVYHWTMRALTVDSELSDDSADIDESNYDKLFLKDVDVPKTKKELEETAQMCGKENR